jgi:hypothetical protein
MAESPHYKELLRLLDECQVEYLIVGGYAVMKYTEPRYTKDQDIWIRNSPENSRRLFQALAKFGAPLNHDGITPETFTKDNPRGGHRRRAVFSGIGNDRCVAAGFIVGLPAPRRKSEIIS